MSTAFDSKMEIWLILIDEAQERRAFIFFGGLGFVVEHRLVSPHLVMNLDKMHRYPAHGQVHVRLRLVDELRDLIETQLLGLLAENEKHGINHI